MAQITLYLDEETEALVRAGAEAQGVSRSRWVAQLIQRQAQATWPPQWAALAGAFPGFPLRDEAMSSPGGEDVKQDRF